MFFFVIENHQDFKAAIQDKLLNAEYQNISGISEVSCPMEWVENISQRKNIR